MGDNDNIDDFHALGIKLAQGTEVGRHYTVNAVRDMRGMLKDFEPDEINYVFLSTSGVHGSYLTLRDIVAEPAVSDITVAVLQPRMCTVYYGNAIVEGDEDIRFLQRLMMKSLLGIVDKQKGNIPDDLLFALRAPLQRALAGEPVEETEVSSLRGRFMRWADSMREQPVGRFIAAQVDRILQGEEPDAQS